LATTDNLFFFKNFNFSFWEKGFLKKNWRKFLQSEKFKIRKRSDFGGIPLPEVILYFCQISMCVCVFFFGSV
jgi:hypothetical protein